MTSVNEMNAINRTRNECRDLHNRFGALLIAVQKLPLDQRKVVLTQYETNYKNMNKLMEPDTPFIDPQDTQEADFNRSQDEERHSQQFDDPKD